MEARARRWALVFVVTLLLVFPCGALAASRVVSGDTIEHELRAGRAVVLENVFVVTSLTLRGVIRGVFKCAGCVFEGRLSAKDVTFEDTVDLEDSTFRRTVAFDGVAFRGLFQCAGCVFEGRLSAKDVTFEDRVNLGRSQFNRAAFDGVAFRGDAMFSGAAFAAAAEFIETDFRHRTDFSQALFTDGASFISSQFGEGASFLGVQFMTSSTALAARFQNVTSTGDLDFTFAQFGLLFSDHPASASTSIAVFAGLVCAGLLDFTDATFETHALIVMERLKVAEMVADVGLVLRIEDKHIRRQALQTIERSAKDRDDLARANEAHYALQVMRSKDYGSARRVLDYVFYRGVAGYFVRPARPLIVLLVIASILSVLRVIRHRGGSPTQPLDSKARARRIGGRAWRRAGDLLTSLLDAFSMVGPRWRGSQRGSRPLGQRLEILAYRVLLVCALIGLANSNPALREMADALF